MSYVDHIGLNCVTVSSEQSREDRLNHSNRNIKTDQRFP